MRNFGLVILLVLVSLVLTGCATAIQTIDQLPEEGVKLISVLLTAGFMWLALKIFELLGVDLKGYVPGLVSAIAPIAVAFIEQYLKLIPPIFDSLVLAVIHMLWLWLGGLGVYLIYRKRVTPTLKPAP